VTPEPAAPIDTLGVTRPAVGASGQLVVVPSVARPTGVRASVGAYVRLTKPRVVELLLVTTVPAMILAERGWPSTWLVLAVLVGGSLGAGGANATNCWIERDRDQLMRRTASRPLPAGEITPTRALVFAILLEVAAFGFLWATANLLTAGLVLAAALFYVFVYTIWLKPRTPQNIVIGGAAGAVPVLAGWAAVTGTLDASAWVLFAIIFLWTPPHFWALSIKYREDYARAGVPMLPVVVGVRRTTEQILGYSVVVVVASLVLTPVAEMGTIYAVVAPVAGMVFVWRAWRLRGEPTDAEAIRLFVLSNLYLALLFVAVAVDVFV
jgi:protoheme IX farnesyltransferase